MAADASIVFLAELDSSGIKAGLNKLGRMTAKWSKGLGVSLAAVTTGMGALAKSALTYNSQMENYTTNFGVMLNDEARAVEHVAQLREMAAKTPFGMSELADASQTLMSFGMSAEDSQAAMQRLGDISLGNKERFQSLSLAFAQVSASGKLTGQDLLQMVNAGFNPLQTIAEKTGTSIADLKDVMAGGKGSKEFRKQVKAAQKEVKKLGENASDGAKMLAQIGEDGAISAEMVGRAMEIATSPGGKFYEGMAKAALTMSGMISTLQDDAMELSGKVFEPMSESIKNNLLPLAQGYIKQLSDAFERTGTDGLVSAMGSVLGDAVTQVAGALPDVLSIASGLLTSIGNSITENADTIKDGLTDAISAIVNSGLPQTSIETIGELGGAILSAVSTGLTENADELIQGLTAGINTLLSGDGVSNAVTSFFGLAESIINGISGALPELLPNLAGALVDGIGTAFASLPNALSAGKKLLEGLKKGLVGEDGSGGAIGTLAQGIIDGIEKFFATHFPVLKFDLPDWEDIVEWATNLKNKIEEFFTVEVAIVDGTMQEYRGPGQEFLLPPEGEENLIDLGELLGDWFVPSAGAEELPPQVNQVANQLAGQTQQELLDAFENKQISYDQLVAAAFGSGGEGVADQAAAAGKEGGEGEGEANPIAMQMIQSITSGLEANAGLIKTSLQASIDNSKNGINVSAFNGVGLQISYGIAAGIRSGTGAVVSAVQSVIAAALAAAEKAAEINSPSRLFRDRIGLGIDEGVAVGISDNRYLVRRAVNEMVLDSVPNMRSIGSRAASMMSAALDNGSVAAAARYGTLNQTNNFNVPVQTPDEFANTMHMYATYGLAAKG